jgi:hypothetical protein
MKPEISLSIRNIRFFMIVGTLGIFLLLNPIYGCHSKTIMIATQQSKTEYTLTITPIISLHAIISQTPTPTNPPTLTPSPTTLPGCKQPSDNYDIIEIYGHKLNQRTYQMLVYAKELYQGPIDITADAITQGSYTSAVEASFGTHAGGGAVDISIMAHGTYTILSDEIEPLIYALRLAGFAAWYRDFNALYEGSPPHIHAIAIGDRELSIAAREQLAGPFGYFWGYNGLPTEDGKPIRDSHGGPIVCEWMIEKGYPNKTATPSANESFP